MKLAKIIFFTICLVFNALILSAARVPSSKVDKRSTATARCTDKELFKMILQIKNLNELNSKYNKSNSNKISYYLDENHINDPLECYTNEGATILIMVILYSKRDQQPLALEIVKQLLIRGADPFLKVQALESDSSDEKKEAGIVDFWKTIEGYDSFKIAESFGRQLIFQELRSKKNELLKRSIDNKRKEREHVTIKVNLLKKILLEAVKAGDVEKTANTIKELRDMGFLIQKHKFINTPDEFSIAVKKRLIEFGISTGINSFNEKLEKTASDADAEERKEVKTELKEKFESKESSDTGLRDSENVSLLDGQFLEELKKMHFWYDVSTEDKNLAIYFYENNTLSKDAIIGFLLECAIENVIAKDDYSRLKELLRYACAAKISVTWPRIFIHALQNNKEWAIDILISCKANPLYSFRDKKTIFHVIFENMAFYEFKPFHLRLLKTCIEKTGGIILKLTDKKGRIPLHYAAQNGLFEAVKLMTESTMEKIHSIFDNNGRIPLDLARESLEKVRKKILNGHDNKFNRELFAKIEIVILHLEELDRDPFSSHDYDL